MTVLWDAYTPYVPEVRQPLREVTRREARGAFNRLMAAKAERIDELRRLLASNGLVLSSDDEGLQRVNDWFRAEVEKGETPGRLRSVWYAVVNDLALFLGDVAIERCPGLEWVMFDKGAKNVAYQKHVIMGFTKVANPSYNFDVDRVLATYGHQIIAGEEVPSDAFITWISSVEAKA